MRKVNLVELAPNDLVLPLVLLNCAFTLVRCDTHLRTKRRFSLVYSPNLVALRKELPAINISLYTWR